jgi:hypothetical protein
MRQRAPLALSIAALVVAVLGWTQLGQAAKEVVTGPAAKRPPLPTIVYRGAEVGVGGPLPAKFELRPRCEPGEKVIGGGGGFVAATGSAYLDHPDHGTIVNSGPAVDGNAIGAGGTPTNWLFTVVAGQGTRRVIAYAVCMKR